MFGLLDLRLVPKPKFRNLELIKSGVRMASLELNRKMSLIVRGWVGEWVEIRNQSYQYVLGAKERGNCAS